MFKVREKILTQQGKKLMQFKGVHSAFDVINPLHLRLQ